MIMIERTTPVNLNHFEITEDNILIYDNGMKSDAHHLTFRGPFDSYQDALDYYNNNTWIVNKIKG